MKFVSIGPDGIEFFETFDEAHKCASDQLSKLWEDNFYSEVEEVICGEVVSHSMGTNGDEILTKIRVLERGQRVRDYDQDLEDEFWSCELVKEYEN